ncbi:YciI family protein [Vitiosangium sp. GDMCC 1.1324]|uniref:YciI family protein n=1 Tax=Vitiosangium sp. (strain GDMCC 1.1324) TaxID=2138576 RepID=UPI000D3C7272|nr:YciI family protein [Vitiosangium sp. GDMCC 1.1324]PTL84868.1 dehydrogenase [Vitiosangium sp. GDMCC 1.1324]
MRFLLIPAPPSSDAKVEAEAPFDEKLFTAYMKYNEEMHKAGVLVASEGLNPNAKSAHVKLSREKRTVVDGPFAETKELIAGFWLIDVKSREEAIEWALRCPKGPGGDEVLEIRPLTGANDLPLRLRELIAEAAPTWSAAFSKS